MMLSNRLKKIIKIILPIIYIVYFSNITFFSHSHIIDDIIIVHDHLFSTDKDGNPTHTHTKSEIQLIHTLSVFFALSTILFFLTIIEPVLPATPAICEYTFSVSKISAGTHKRLRAPPIL